MPPGIWFTLGRGGVGGDRCPDVGVLQADWSTVGPGSPLVVFAHGSGSSRRSPRNRAVAGHLQDRGFATLLLDLLTVAEDEVEQRGGGCALTSTGSRPGW